MNIKSLTVEGLEYFKGKQDSFNDSKFATKASVPDVDSSLSAISTNPVQNKVIKEALDGKANSSHGHSVASVSSDGFMSAADKAKLDGISGSGADYTAGNGIEIVDNEIGIHTSNVKTVAQGSVSGNVVSFNMEHVFGSGDGAMQGHSLRADGTYFAQSGNMLTLKSDVIPNISIASDEDAKAFFGY